jgi:crotonobetainyl-CoA:carnitine CoA-transferase CaiB-like acyl-CoA transferase
MKKLLTLTGIAGIGAVLAVLAACQTTGTGDVVAQKESLLSQSGFKIVTVTTPKQQQAVSGLAQGRVSAVKYNGKLYYVYPTAQKDRIYVGKQKQFNAYKAALAGSQPASQPAQPGQQLMNPAPTMTYEGAGPHHVEVQQFDGFGPMGTASLGDW